MTNAIRGRSQAQFDHNVAWQSARTAEKYDDRRFSSRSGRIFNRREQQAISECLDLIESKNPLRRILDLPCGTGRISELLVSRGYEVVCGDISDEMMQVAKAKLQNVGSREASFAVLDIYDIDYEDDSLDCVTCIRLFQHLTSEERVRALREMHRVTSAHVIVNVTYNTPYYRIIRGIRKALGRYAPRYVVTRKEFRKEMKKAGLQAVKEIFPQPGYNGNCVILLKK